ncbi:MAG: ABC transporter permease [Phycisphaerales bacterium]
MATPDKTAIRRGLPMWFVPLAALIVLVAFTITYELAVKGHSDFISPENLLNILRQWSFVGIIAVGMTFVIILGGIDLSVGSLVAMIGGVGILTLNAVMKSSGNELFAVILAFIVMLLVGTGAGFVNGFLVTRGRIAPFIATLGGLAAFRSVALALADGGEYRSRSAAWFSQLGAGGIPIPFTNLAPASVDGVPAQIIPLLLPWPVLIFIIIAGVAWLLLNRTRYGRYVIAIGCNERAARYSAINVERIKLLTYTLLGFCTGTAGALLAGRMNSVSSSTTGMLYELDVIAAVVIGGTRMRGGAGSVVGTLVGVLILGVIGNMLNLLQVSTYWQGLVKGLIIIAAVLLQRAERTE